MTTTQQHPDSGSKLGMVLCFLFMPILLITGYSVSWSYPGRVDSALSLVNFGFLLACGALGTYLFRHQYQKISSKATWFIIIAGLYLAIFCLIYSEPFVKWFNGQVIQSGNAQYCWNNDIACTNTIARKKLNPNLCYKSGLDTAECIADIAIAQNDFSVCNTGGVALMYQNRCLEIFAAKTNNVNACNLIAWTEATQIVPLKKACAQQAKAITTERLEDCPDDKKSGGEHFNQCLEDIAVKTENPDLCENMSQLSDITGQTRKSEFERELEINAITICRKKVMNVLER
jgi:hypothetical protein